MASTTTSNAAVAGGVSYYSRTNNNINSYPLILNKVTLRYQDGGKIRDDPGSLYEDHDDDIYYQNEINDDNISINEPFYFDSHNNRNNNKLTKKGDKINLERNLSIEKSLNRLSLLKFRENNAGGSSSNASSSQNVESSRKPKKNHNKVNAIVSEIVPLITNREHNEITPSIYNDYFDQASTYVPSVKSHATGSTTLPKVSRTASLYQAKSSTRSNAPSATPIISQSLPRPYSNNIKNKSKVFNLVFGINNKFIQKYLPRDQKVTKHSLYLNEKLPGHIALYKLMKENEKLNTNPNSTNELERLRKEIITRNSLTQVPIPVNSSNDANNNGILATSRLQQEQLSPRIENISPINFSFNKQTLQRTHTFHEITTRKSNSISNSYTRSQSPTSSIGIQPLKNPDSVAAYLSHLKQDK